MPTIRKTLTYLLAALLVVLLAHDEAAAKKKKKKDDSADDPYAEYVWPPPPNPARIKLERVIAGRTDVEGSSKLRKALLGASPQSPYDRLRKPFAVGFDSQGRILVTDTVSAALIRFDREEERMDVFGTRGMTQLKTPLGLAMGPDDTAYVADPGLRQVVAFSPEGKLVGVYGRMGELTNPTDSALSPDGSKLYVSDSKTHQIVVFDTATAEQVATIGRRGEGPGEFNFPTSLAFGPEGNLFVVDQINSRVQVLDAEGEYVDEFGALGVGFGNFVRPKDIAIDEVGFIYVTDNAFNNVQIFDFDFTLLTYVGQGGQGPGRFHGASGIAVRGEEFAVVDQLGHRLQIFRFLVPKDA